MQKKRKQENRCKDERENSPDERAYNLSLTLKTSTVDPQDFGLAVANPVYEPYVNLEGLSGMDQGASGVHQAQIC